MRKFLMAVATVFSLSVVLAAACQSGNTVAPGQEFQLKIGEQSAISGEDLAVKFLSVNEDSRCPTGVM